MALNWNNLRIFHAVTVAGSFTRATDILSLSQSAISRQIHTLEHELGTPVFDRKARGLQLTPAGNRLNQVVTTVFGKLAMVETALSEEKFIPKGHLVVLAPTSIGALLIAPRLKEFLGTFPEMNIDLRLTSEDIGLPTDGIDMSIMSLPIEHSDYVLSKPVLLKTRLYASPKYLAEYGTPQTLEELDHHRLIVSSQGTPGRLSKNWLLNLGARTPRTPYMVIESSLGRVEAIRSGLGIGYSYKYLVGDSTDFVEILADKIQLHHERRIAYPKPLADLKRTQVFAHFLLGLLQHASM